MKIFDLLDTWNTTKGTVNIVDINNIEDSLFYGDLEDALRSPFAKLKVFYWNAEDKDRYIEIGVEY